MPPTKSRNPLLLALTALPIAASGGVYKCRDQDNKTFYQDRPCQELTSTELSPALSKLAPTKERRSPLWKLEQGQRKVFLMASLGYGQADMYPLQETVMDAFAGSAVLLVTRDLDVGSAVTDDPKIHGMGVYPDEGTMEKHVKPATWQQVLALGKTLKISEEKLAAQKPWFAALNLKNAALRQAGFDLNLPVEKAFTSDVKAVKPMVELDSLIELAEFADKLSDAEQEQMLLQALREASHEAGYFRSLADAWKSGDGNALEFAARMPSGSSVPKSEQSWMEKQEGRTEAVADKINEMSEDGRTYFVIVNARQLLGNRGILAILRSQGFTASQL